MNPIKGEQLLAQLNWRYATQHFDPTGKISPWTFVLISDKQTREKLFPSTYNQRKILDCSHYVVFAVKTKMTEEHIDRHIARAVEVRRGTVEKLRGYREVMVDDVVTGERSAQSLEWGARQAYLALGNFMTSAALMGIDTCPMEGFKPDEYDKILDLGAKGLASVVCCAAGYRSANDKYATQKKVRFPREQVIHII